MRTTLGLVGCLLLLTSACVVVEEDDCPEGTRGCECYPDDGCESTSLRCVDDVCVRQDDDDDDDDDDDGGTGGTSPGTGGSSAGKGGSTSSGGSTSNAGSGGSGGSTVSGDALCEAMWDAVSSKCGTDVVYRELVIEDCVDRRERQPERCLGEYDAGIACMGSPASFTCNDSGQATLIGCTEEDDAHQTCLFDGPESQCVAYPETAAIAGMQESWGESVKVQPSLSFYTQGSLRSLDGTECTPSSATQPPTSMVGWMSCWEPYDCGGCEMWLGYFEGDDNVEESWWLIHPRTTASGETCDDYSAFYRVLDPGQGSSNMGSGAPPTPPGTSTACDDCLDACDGLGGCCTGTGCICESACKPTSCASPARMCCGPYGDCFCTENCPY